MKCIILRRRLLTLAACAVAALAIFTVVNHPAVVGVSATTRQLPIYSVERDQKMISISFDAAWGEVRLRLLSRSRSWSRGCFTFF